MSDEINQAEGQSDQQCVVRRDYRVMSDKFTEIVASNLHYFERVEGIDLTRATADEVRCLSDRWILRYRNEPSFNAKVRKITAQLMAEVTDA